MTAVYIIFATIVVVFVITLIVKLKQYQHLEEDSFPNKKVKD